MAKTKNQMKAKLRINAYVRIAGIDGPITQKGYEKTFPANTYSVGMSGVGHVPGRETAAKREPKPQCGDFHLTIIGSHNTHEMFRRVLGGTLIASIMLTRPAMDGGGKKDHTHTVENVVITGAEMSLDEDGNCLIVLVCEYAKWRHEGFSPENTSLGAVEYDIPKGQLT
jgi:hypothetical protein